MARTPVLDGPPDSKTTLKLNLLTSVKIDFVEWAAEEGFSVSGLVTHLVHLRKAKKMEEEDGSGALA